MGKIRLFQFSILSKFQNLDFQGKKNENIGENPAERDEHSFFCQNSETLISKPCQGVRNYESMNSQTILDINYVDFLQFQWYFTPQAELEEAFIYIIYKPIDFSIDFSCRLKT